MAGQIEIKKYSYRSICDVHRCSERSQVSIGIAGESPAFNHNYCEVHLKQIIDKGLKYFVENYGRESLNDIEVISNIGFESDDYVYVIKKEYKVLLERYAAMEKEHNELLEKYLEVDALYRELANVKPEPKEGNVPNENSNRKSVGKTSRKRR